MLDPMFLRSGSLLIALFVKKNIMNSVLLTVTTASSRLYVVRVEAFFLAF